MSLEAKLDALGEQIVALTTVTTSLLNLRTEAIENVKAAAAPSPRKKKDEVSAAETKTDETPAAKPAEKSADPSVPAAGELSEVQAAVARYVGAEGISEAERAARSGEVKKVLAHPKVNAAKVSEIPVEMAPAVIKAVEGLIARGNLIQEEAASETVDDLLG